jgi:hypothetical protein
MIVKLLGIELQYNAEINDMEIIVDYGKILERKDFKEVKNQIERLKKKIVKIILKEIDNI